MPSGYTSQIKEGISFEKFALSCARAFGACIALRDESSDVLPTVENIKLSDDDYYEKKIIEAESDLKYYQNASKEELNDEFETYVADQISYNKQAIIDKTELKKKYENMLQKVNEWNPPSKDHIELKKFMISQITDSIKWDCNIDYYEDAIVSYSELTLEEWINTKIESVERNLKYNREREEKNKQADQKRVEWVQQLINSLK